MKSVQKWDPERYAKNARFVADLGMPVIELLAPKPGERILDLGCGDGALTARLAELGCEVVGVDSSPELIAAARKLGLDARVADGQRLAFEGGFDAVFSNAALHWMLQADDVIAGVYRALKPGGRFVAEMGGHGCIASIKEALLAALDRRGVDGRPVIPWYFPTSEDYSSRLVRAGFAIRHMALFPRPTTLPGDVIGWLETFAGSFTTLLPEAERPRFLAEVADALRPRLRSDGGKLVADYWRLRFAAVKQ